VAPPNPLLLLPALAEDRGRVESQLRLSVQAEDPFLTEVAGLLAATIARLCEGQVLELQHTFDVGRTEEAYLASIDGKTASLLATACRVGGAIP